MMKLKSFFSKAAIFLAVLSFFPLAEVSAFDLESIKVACNQELPAIIAKAQGDRRRLLEQVHRKILQAQSINVQDYPKSGLGTNAFVGLDFDLASAKVWLQDKRVAANLFAKGRLFLSGYFTSTKPNGLADSDFPEDSLFIVDDEGNPEYAGSLNEYALAVLPDVVELTRNFNRDEESQAWLSRDAVSLGSPAFNGRYAEADSSLHFTVDIPFCGQKLWTIGDHYLKANRVTLKINKDLLAQQAQTLTVGFYDPNAIHKLLSFEVVAKGKAAYQALVQGATSLQVENMKIECSAECTKDDIYPSFARDVSEAKCLQRVRQQCKRRFPGHIGEYKFSSTTDFVLKSSQNIAIYP